MRACLIAWLLALGAGSACSPVTELRSGTIRLEAYVYNDPTGDLYDSFRVPIGTLYFYRDRFLEELPAEAAGAGDTRYRLVVDSQYARLQAPADIPRVRVFHPLGEKPGGALFIPPPVPGFDLRQPLADTAFGGFDYRRFAVADGASYAVFYVHQTDTVLPFSLARQFERVYGGVVNRIDTYDRGNDRFVSLRMAYTDSIPDGFVELLKRIVLCR